MERAYISVAMFSTLYAQLVLQIRDMLDELDDALSLVDYAFIAMPTSASQRCIPCMRRCRGPARPSRRVTFVPWPTTRQACRRLVHGATLSQQHSAGVERGGRPVDSLGGHETAVGSTGHCNTALSLSAGVSNPKVFLGRWFRRNAILFRYD